MAEGLIGVVSHILHGNLVTMSRRRRVRSVAKGGRGLVGLRTKRLIGIGCLFGGDAAGLAGAVVGGTAGAAARGDDPEEAAGEREGDRQPGGDIDVLAHVALDAVVLEGRVEGAFQDGEEGGGRDGGGGDEEEGDLCLDVSDGNIQR
jgi:hypothetical protein